MPVRGDDGTPRPILRVIRPQHPAYRAIFVADLSPHDRGRKQERGRRPMILASHQEVTDL